MKTLYLHIGLGKTGTTSIQMFLGNHCHQLRKDGVHYVHCAGGEEGVGHQGFAKSFIAELPGYMIVAKGSDSIRKDLKSEITASTENCILLSSENFSLAEPEKVKHFFSSFDEEFMFKIILFIRSQDDLAESEYNQMIKVRSEKRSFFQYVQNEFDGDFLSLATRWEQVFGRENMVCKIYNARSRSVFNDFFECLPGTINIKNYTIIDEDQDANKSLGFMALNIKRMLNILQKNDAYRKHIELPENIKEICSTIDMPPVLINSIEARELRNTFKDVNREFCKRYLDEELSELGGNRYSDDERDMLYKNVKFIHDIFSKTL